MIGDDSKDFVAALDAYRDAVSARRFHNGTKNEAHWQRLLAAERNARSRVIALATKDLEREDVVAPPQSSNKTERG